MQPRHLLASLTLLVGVAVSAPALAQDEEPLPAPGSGGTLPVRVVDGRLIVTCDLSTPANRIPANLFVEIEGRHGLQLHNRAAASLRAESADGTPRAITLHFPDFTVQVPRRELGDEELFEEFTKYHSAEMGENALVGSIGVEVLRRWKVTLDVGNGAVRLDAPIEVSGPEGAPPTSVFVEPDGTVVAPLTLIDDMVWLPVRWANGDPGGLMLGTSVYDTRIDARAASGRGRPAGDVGPIRIGGVDLHRFVAFRPEPVVQVHPDGVVGITGVNLLEDVELSVDRTRRELRLRPTREPDFPEDDLVFFRARADEDPEAIVAFLEAYEGARLAREGARLLLDYRLSDAAPMDEVQAAVQWMYDTMVGDLRTTRMLDLMNEMADAGEDDVVIAAGKLGIEAGRDDRYPNAVHSVHGRLGRTLLDQGSGDDAWRHLLSAAFGLPEDGRINLDLGRFYEQQGRHRRAFSRYVQAVIREDSGAEALEALQRVQPLLVDDAGNAEPFSVSTIERMIEGKVRNFGAASRFVPDDDNPAIRTVLCEFFTNGHLGNETRGGAIGGALGFEGMISHFEPEHVVFLEYHLPTPKPDALCNELGRARAALLGIENPTVMMIDGQTPSPGAGKWRQAEAIYMRARSATLGRLAENTDHDVDLVAWYEDGRITGSATVFGPEEDGLRVQVVLAEAGVLYPGSSGVVVHRHVARASMVGSVDGIPYEPADLEMEVPFEISLEGAEERQLAFFDVMEDEDLGSPPRISTRVDPNQARVVAFVFDGNSGAVLSAYSTIPEGIESEDAEQSVPGEKDGGR
ncbi:MAG: hypothetical protein AAF726_01795 [Planctomycetota bacterium]